MEENDLFNDWHLGTTSLENYNEMDAEDLLNMLCAPLSGTETQDYVILLRSFCSIFSYHFIASKYFLSQTLQVLPTEVKAGDENPTCTGEQSVLDELNLLLGQVLDGYTGSETLDKEKVTLAAVVICSYSYKDNYFCLLM